MDNKNPINDLMQESMAKIRELADTNTIVGQPIQTPDGVTLIPISRVSMGMGGGGTIFGKKKDTNPEGNLGSGMGVGVHIDPVAFLIVKDGITRVMPVAVPPMNTVDRIVEMVPDVMDKVTNFIDSRKKKEEEPETDESC
ncbi:MAG: sporulation protein YtfJ [Oscillospiraceae bacterium]|nr:sporulation protein YtfJ [Oscillospiraceae bacterium]